SELVQLTLLRNATLQAAQLQLQAAGSLVEAEAALYDPTAYGRVRREVVNRPRTYEERTASLTNINDADAIENLVNVGAGVRGKLPTGGSLDLSHDMRRRQSNLLATPQEREYRGTVTLSFKQPLWRGYGRDAVEADLRVADKERQIEQQRLLKQVLDLVGEAAGTYWQLQRADQTQALRNEAVRAAEALRDEVQRRVAAGFAPRVELFEAETLIGGRRTEAAKAEQQVVEVQARVRNLLSLDPVGERGARPPAFRAEAARFPAEFDAADEALVAPPAQLVERWPGFQMARLRHEQEGVRLDLARNQEQPDLSFELGYNLNSLTSRSGKAYDGSIQNKHPGWSVGIVLERAIGNDGPRAKRDAQAARTEAARLQADTEARVARNEWAVRASQLAAVRREVRQVRLEVASRQALLGAEREQYQLGRSRLRQLMEAQDRVDDARLRQLDAEVRERLAWISLQAISGDLFDHYGVKIGA
ncbi:MAG: TolC family protein, partial [Leptothrix sp. (in: b-proteobacteria)]